MEKSGIDPGFPSILSRCDGLALYTFIMGENLISDMRIRAFRVFLYFFLTGSNY
jgi:hypothetical protein